MLEHHHLNSVLFLQIDYKKHTEYPPCFEVATMSDPLDIFDLERNRSLTPNHSFCLLASLTLIEPISTL